MRTSIPEGGITLDDREVCFSASITSKSESRSSMSDSDSESERITRTSQPFSFTVRILMAEGGGKLIARGSALINPRGPVGPEGAKAVEVFLICPGMFESFVGIAKHFGASQSASGGDWVADSHHAHSRFQPRFPLSTARVESRVERSGTEFPARGVTLTLAFHPGSRFQPRGWTAGWRGVERSFLRGASRSLPLSTKAPAFNREGGEQDGEGVDGQLGPGPFLYVENRDPAPNTKQIPGPHRQNTRICPQKPRVFPTPIGTPIPPCLSKFGGAAPGLMCIDAMGGTVESREEVQEYAASGRKVPGGKDVSCVDRTHIRLLSTAQDKQSQQIRNLLMASE
ncbi:hypothetical protein B0H10DRAFT_1972911 [Mycena sp. CBHHK59/15]|nr:hypothetical protein B0H10DRAFT_1972911 [Mycena sp. CBHHK59/15]